MHPLGDEIRREVARLGPPARTAEVVAAWPEAVGPSVAGNAWPSRLSRDGTLHVATSSSAWAFELAQLAPQILERLRDELGGGAPTALRFAAGPLPERGAGDAASPARCAVEPGAEERRAAAALAAAVGNDELRDLVARAAAASLARAAHDRPV